MKKKHDTPVYEQLITACQLPKDVFLGASIISMTGNKEMIIENFKNIVQYFPEKLILKCQNNQIQISGSQLVIELYSKEEIKIKGEIKEIKFL